MDATDNNCPVLSSVSDDTNYVIIKSHPFTIGRSQGSTLCILSMLLSRTQAVIEKRCSSNEWTIREAVSNVVCFSNEGTMCAANSSSKAITYVNNVPLKNDVVVLNGGDIIQFSAPKHKFKFWFPNEEARKLLVSNTFKLIDDDVKMPPCKKSKFDFLINAINSQKLKGVKDVPKTTSDEQMTGKYDKIKQEFELFKKLAELDKMAKAEQHEKIVEQYRVNEKSMEMKHAQLENEIKTLKGKSEFDDQVWILQMNRMQTKVDSLTTDLSKKNNEVVLLKSEQLEWTLKRSHLEKRIDSMLNDIREKNNEIALLKSKLLEVNLHNQDLNSSNTYYLNGVNVMKDVITNVLDSDFQCSICNEFFIEATSTQCKHTFCAYCIQCWCSKSSKCPICRKPILFVVKTLAIDSVITQYYEMVMPDAKAKRNEILATRKEEHRSLKVDDLDIIIFSDNCVSQIYRLHEFLSNLPTSENDLRTALENNGVNVPPNLGNGINGIRKTTQGLINDIISNLPLLFRIRQTMNLTNNNLELIQPQPEIPANPPTTGVQTARRGRRRQGPLPANPPFNIAHFFTAQPANPPAGRFTRGAQPAYQIQGQGPVFHNTINFVQNYLENGPAPQLPRNN